MNRLRAVVHLGQLLLFAFVLNAYLCWSQATFAVPPQIFFTDLVSGPATGGQDEQGAFITVYGIGFGSQRGSSWVSIGSGRAAAYPLWTNSKITVQVGKRATTGNIVAHVTGSPESNGSPFTIRPGHIYFVSNQGSDVSSGSYASPWKTITHATHTLMPGDIAYAMGGVQQVTLDAYDASLSIQTSGRAGAPIALVAYPGATVVIGSLTGPAMAARTPNIDRTSDHWVLAGLTFRGKQEGLDLTASKDWRIIGNDFSCPTGFGPTGCVETGQANYIAFLGNNVHDIAKPGTTKTYHAVYFSTDSNHIEVGWNTIARVHSCRGLQFHSSPLDPGTGNNQYDLHVHDNVIHDTVCDGINFATVDPSKGPVEAYNNVIYNTGSGPDPEDGEANYACIYVQGGSEHGPAGSGAVEIYHNTLYNCGARKNTDSGALAFSNGSPLQFTRLRNNIVLQKRGESYLTPNSNENQFTGENNIFWGSSDSVSLLQRMLPNLIYRDPMLSDPAAADFTLREGSPAVQAGATTGLRHDISGRLRPLDKHPDIGAGQRLETNMSEAKQLHSLSSSVASGTR